LLASSKATISALAFCSPILTGIASLEAGETEAWKVEWEKTQAAAKREGQLVVYMGGGYDAALKAFQKKFPEIRLTVITGGGSQQGVKIMAERRAGKYLADVYSGGPTTPHRVLYRNKALDPIRTAFILPEVIDESRWWSGKQRTIDADGEYIFVYVGNASGASIAYNTGLVNPAPFTSYWDLLHPRWRGKMESRDPRLTGVTSPSLRFLYHNPKLGPKFMQRLYSEMEIAIFRDDRLGPDWLAKGKFAICLFCSGIDDAKLQGLPVESFYTLGWREGAGINTNFGTLSLLNRAPHPNAARVFINWFLSREGQSALQEAMNTPANSLESLRTDIPKHMIPAMDRRVAGVDYMMVDQPEWMDMKPIYDVVSEALAQTGKK
jgi:iron(III) transport system substrate-binding protein